MRAAIDKSVQWIESKGDWLNAILVKETRQALKSRQFVATFMLLLLSSWLISLFYIVLEGDAINYGDAGPNLFMMYFLVLIIAITVVVPFGAFRSLLNEKDMNTYDVLCITSLSPRQIVWGKLLSALLQVFIYYSAIAPFIAFTSLLEGFELPAVAFVLVMGFFVSLAYSITSLMICTFANQRHWQAILSIALLVGQCLMLFAWMGITSELMRFNPFDDAEFWWVVGLTLAIGLSYCWLFLQITTAQLTFETGNRSSGIRLTAAVQQILIMSVVTALLSYLIGRIPTGVVEGFIMVMGICALIHWTLVGLIAATEDDFLSRRIRKSLPRSKGLRLLFAPFLPGGSRGLVYLLLNLGVLIGFLTGWASLDGFSNDSLLALMGIVVGVLYVVFYIGLGSLFGRVARRKWTDLKPSHVRVLTLLFALTGIIAPFLLGALDLIRFNTYSIAHISNPIVTIGAILDGRDYGDSATIIIAVAATAILLLNLPAMSNGVREIVGAPTEPREETQPSVEYGVETAS